MRVWIHRFQAAGLDGLADRARAGRPPTYAPEQVASVIATALTDPKTLDLPFASWTLDRLARFLHEQKGIAIKRSRIDAILLAAGLPGASTRLGSVSGSSRRSPKKDPMGRRVRGPGRVRVTLSDPVETA